MDVRTPILQWLFETLPIPTDAMGCFGSEDVKGKTKAEVVLLQRRNDEQSEPSLSVDSAKDIRRIWCRELIMPAAGPTYPLTDPLRAAT